MTPPSGLDPCLTPVRRHPVRGRDRVRVLQLLATGTNGGAQEHVYNLVSRMDRDRYDVSAVSLSPGSAVRKLERLGIPVSVIDEPDDAIATGILAAHLADLRPDVLHNHMYRAEIVGTKAAIAVGEAGHRRPWILSTVHSSRVRSAEDQAELRRLTPSMDHLIVVSHSIDRKVVEEGRTTAPRSLIYNGIDLDRYDHQEPCCTLRDEYAMEPTSPIVGVVGRLELEKGHPTLLEAWPMVLEAVPSAYLLIVGEGSRLDALRQIARDQGVEHHVVFTGRRDDIPAVTAAFDVAVLPSYREAQGLTILEAMALSRPVVASNVGGIPEMIEDGVTGLLVPPQDPPALAAAIVRLLRDHPLADILGRAGHDVVHDRFCVQLMVNAIQGLYDEGARAVRPREVTPLVGAGPGSAAAG
jgi:glycosyltransferase involved in cell wall biosynthesis